MKDVSSEFDNRLWGIFIVSSQFLVELNLIRVSKGYFSFDRHNILWHNLGIKLNILCPHNPEKAFDTLIKL